MRPITLASGQFGDMPLEKLCELASGMGYDGLELACHAHFNINKALEDSTYIPYVKSVLDRYGLKCWAISAHLAGQCVGDEWDERLNNFAPSVYADNPDKIREWAIKQMMLVPKAAAKLGVDVVTGFMGSPIWAKWYSFPQTSREMVERGYQKIVELWTPIFDEFDSCKIKFALEVHPTEIAFDYYSTQKLFQTFGYRKTLGLNYDPSHLVWQGVNELIFLRDFADQIYHVHIKDVKLTRDDKAGVLGSHLEFGDTRRGWNFVSVGHGDVDFDGIIRELNQMGYQGPLSVEWEDSGMERETGARESLEYVKRYNFIPSESAFDSELKVE